jgi:hypothetical protein
MRAVTVTIVYDQDIARPRELYEIHEQTAAQYDGVVGVHAREATPEEETRARTAYRTRPDVQTPNRHREPAGKLCRCREGQEQHGVYDGTNTHIHA